MTWLELGTAVVVGAAAIWFLVGPIGRRRSGPVIEDPLPLEETARGQALVELAEIDFDHATGKLSDADHAALKRRHLRKAVALLGPASTVSQPNASDQAPSATRPVCPDCGPRPEGDALYCSGCGHFLGQQTTCGECGASLEARAVFCSACGAAVAH